MKAMKARNLLKFMLIATAMIPLAPPASAHHSFAAEYNADNPVTLTGSVTKMAWINPHSWIYIDVKKPDGAVENWAVESAPLSKSFTSWSTEEASALVTLTNSDRIPPSPSA